MLARNLYDSERLRQEIDKYYNEALGAILEIPTDPIETLKANSPFTAYCHIRDLCKTINKEFQLTDRYTDETIFYRYLRDVPETVVVTLITRPEGDYSKADWAELLDIARLYSSERSLDSFHLYTSTSFHDRRLQLDDRLYSLGGSVKDAAKKADFTIAELDFTPENLSTFSDAIANGIKII